MKICLHFAVPKILPGMLPICLQCLNSFVLSPARGQLDGPCVLQVQKVRNVSAPKDHEESQGAPRMLRLQMTDGHTTCVGLEFKHLSKIRYLYNHFVA